MTRLQRKRFWLGTSMLTFAGIAAAQAQSAPPAPSLAQNTGLKPVVITARHRTERAQSVPIPLTVVDANQMKTVGSSNLNKLQQLVPSLTVELFNPRNTAVNIRGLGSVPNIANDGLEGGVGTYVDGVLLARPAQAVFDLPDLQSIEVLRGPQGTLFGKNTVDGAINITTRLPSFAPEADGSISYGTQNYVQLKASASSAIAGSDKLAIRLSVQGTQHNGYVSNTTNSERYSNQDDKGIRAQVLYDATPNLTIRAIYDYSHQHENCCVNLPVGVVSDYADGNPIPEFKNILHLDFLLGYTPQLNDAFARKTDVDSPVYYDMETGGATLLADYDAHGYTISSISGFRYWNWYPHNDSDDTALPVLINNYTDYQRQFSQELRLTSPLGGRIDYTGGLYFFYQSVNGQNWFQYGSAAGTLLSGAAPGTAANTAYTAATNGFIADYNTVFDTRSFAAYGQAVGHVTSKFDITAGLRETYESKTGDFDEIQEGGAPLRSLPEALQPAVAKIRNGISPYEQYGKATDNALPAGLLTFSYKVSPDILTYVTYSHGAKSAGINLVANRAVPNIVAPETINNFELGAKTTLLDNRLLLDGDAFWDEDTNYQGTLIGQTNGTIYSYIASIPKVRSRGVELDVRAQPTDKLNLFFSGVYDDAYNESDPNGQCPIELSNRVSCNLTGKPVAGNSTWVGSFGGEYDQPLPAIHGKYTIAYAGGNVLLKSGFYSGADASKYSYVPGYGIGNVDFGIKSASGAWDFSGWIHNVTNEKYYLYRGASSSASFPTYNLIYAQVGDPISGGVTLSGKF